MRRRPFADTLETEWCRKWDKYHFRFFFTWLVYSLVRFSLCLQLNFQFCVSPSATNCSRHTIVDLVQWNALPSVRCHPNSFDSVDSRSQSWTLWPLSPIDLLNRISWISCTSHPSAVPALWWLPSISSHSLWLSMNWVAFHRPVCDPRIESSVVAPECSSVLWFLFSNSTRSCLRPPANRKYDKCMVSMCRDKWRKDAIYTAYLDFTFTALQHLYQESHFRNFALCFVSSKYWALTNNFELNIIYLLMVEILLKNSIF